MKIPQRIRPAAARQFLLPAIALLLLAACATHTKPTPTPTPMLHIINATPCVLHFRFDNGAPKGRVQPGKTVDYTDARINDYQTMQIESTMAIFRTYDLATARAAGYTVTVKPSFEDHPCVEQPEGIATLDISPSPIH